MTLIKDAINAVREATLLGYKVDKVGSTLTELSHELREHDRRLVRLETLVEVAKIKKLPK